MKKLILLLLFVPLVSFGQDELKLFIKGKNNFEKENYDKAFTYLAVKNLKTKDEFEEKK